MSRELILRSSKGVAVLLFAGVMATLLHSESRRLYSWWWDSHNTPKNSKWLQDNLTDIDAKVKSMIKLIEEDADSFARRAEMYYKKRPELMKLVEEFYRAYRALAERYNHTTGELRHAHRTIARAFPDQVPPELIEDSSPSKSAEQKEFHIAGLKCPLDSMFNPSVSLEDGGKKGLKQLNEISESEDIMRLKAENLILKDKILDETERSEKAEIAILDLEKALSDVESEKGTVLLKYQQCLEKLSKLEEELTNAENDSLMFNAKAITAEIEVQTLKEGLTEMEAQKNKELAKQREYVEKISYLEAMISQANIDMKGLHAKGIEAESQALALKAEISRLELEKEAVVHQCQQSLEKISNLENVVTVLEDEAKELKKQAETAENKVSELAKALTELQKEKEASALKYNCCLETISKLEKDLSFAKDENERLKAEVLVGTARLKAVVEKLTLLEMSNRSLQVQANNLSEKIASKDLELSKKQDELEAVQTCLQDELSRHTQIEVTLQSLQQLHDQSQEDQKILAMELKGVLQMLKDMEGSKLALEQEIQWVRDENKSLNDMSLSSVASLEHMQDEIFSLREIKERLEKEVSNHTSVSVSFQHEILRLKEEIQGLTETSQTLVEQVEAAGLDPKCLETSILSLKNENRRLREKCEDGYIEKANLSQKLEKMEEDLKKNSVLESSLTELNNVLEESHEKLKSLEASCQFLQGEKASLVNEKASLLCQLQAITESMHNLLEKNAVLESSLFGAKVELEGLKEKSKGLEEICGMLKHERSYLLTERDALVSKLENVEKKLETLEKNFLGLEEKYADIEKEKESIYTQVEKLELSLILEKQEQRSSQLLSETRLSGLENQICLLREENKYKKREFEEELEKTIRAQFEISILQKFMKDLEEKNYTLIMECQKHVEASKLAEKVISELESESLEQQVEAELLLDEIEGLRLGIYQIFKCLETDSDFGLQDKVHNEQIFVHHILGNIEAMKSSISKHEDENQQLVVENLVLLALLEQLRCKGMEVESQKIHLEQESIIMSENFASICYEKEKLVQMNEQLKTDLSENRQYASTLKAELERVCAQQDDLQKAYDEIIAAFSQMKRENTDLLRMFSELREEKYVVDQHNDTILLESLKNANESVVLASFGVEKIRQLRLILEDLHRQEEVNSNLVREMSTLREKLVLRKEENLALKDAISSLETQMQQMRGYSDQMSQEILIGNMSLVQAEENIKETEEKLITVEISNSTLCSTVDKLKTEIYELLKIRENLENKMNYLSDNNLVQTQEIKSLQTANLKLESELDFLRDELQEHAIIEQTLHHELEEVNNEFELYEAEAESFYFDLQVSSVREVLFENKVHELTEVCQTLEDDNSLKTAEVAELKGKICSMESEISGLKSQIDAYYPVMASLKDDITLLEHNVSLQAKIKAAQSPKSVIMDTGINNQTNTMQVPCEDQSLLTLQDLRTRVKAVSKLMEEMNKPAISRTRSNRKNGYESEIDQIEPIYVGTPKLRRLRSKNSESRNRVLMKDIPLDQVSNNSSLRRTRTRSNVGSEDQMLELWEEAAEDRSTNKKNGESFQNSFRVREHDIIYDQFGRDKRNFEPPSTDSDIEKELGLDKLNMSVVRRTTEPTRQEVENDDGKILAKLFSDAEKLETLQKTVQHLRRNLESSSIRKKGRKKAKNGVDSETVLEQLAEAEDSIVQLVDFNCQLVKNIEECPTDDKMASPRVKQTTKLWRMKVDEHAQKGSERINRLQIELQKIQYVLLKMNNDEKIKGKNMFLRNRGVVLRDFIYNGRKNSGKRKKGPFCGCFKESSTSRNGRGM